MANSDDTAKRRAQLEQRLRDASADFDREFRSHTSGWRTGIGRFAITTEFDTGVIVLVYVFFNIVCFAAGIVFILQGGVLQALGISFVVGGLFSFGTFMAQWWDHSWQRNNNILDRAFNFGDRDNRYASLRQVAEKYLDAQRQLDDLPDASGS